MQKFIIIGAGPAGIGAALSLKDEDSLVLEKRTDIGGLSSSIEIDGAVFDIGGHSFHTPHPQVRDLVFNALEMYEQRRDARCFSYGKMIPYPFQKHFRKLDHVQDVVDECVNGLDETDDGKNSVHFEEFINRRFGPGIAKHFMLPYNRKLWGRDLKRLAADWVGERVAAPEGVKEKFDLAGGKRKPLQGDTLVAYPAKGGFGEIYTALARDIPKIDFNTDVQRIDPKKHTVYTSNGEYQYQNLISTMPIPELLKRVEGVPDFVFEEASHLDCLALKLVLVVIGHPVDTEIQRVYCADQDIPSHKTAINHNSSDYLRSLKHHGIMAEVAVSPEKPLLRDDLENWVIEGLQKMEIIKSPSEVNQTRIVDAKYAYPVPTADRDDRMKVIKGWLNENDIYPVGRFGDWAYVNSDESIYRGLLLGFQLREL